MKRFCFAIISLLIVTSVDGQDNKLSVYLEGFVDLSTIDIGSNQSGERNLMLFPLPSIALSKEKELFTREIEITPFYYYQNNFSSSNNLDESLSPSGYQYRLLGSSISYNLWLDLYKAGDWGFQLDIMNKAYFHYFDYEPKVSIDYPENESRSGIQTSLGIRIEKQIIDSYAISIMPFAGLNNMFFKTNKIDNPSLPLDQRKASSIVNEIIPGIYGVKLGLSIVK